MSSLLAIAAVIALDGITWDARCSSSSESPSVPDPACRRSCASRSVRGSQWSPISPTFTSSCSWLGWAAVEVGTQIGEKMRQSALAYFADMVVSPLIAGGLSTFALTHFTNYALVRWLATVMLGVALWTLIEYATHRVIYHRVAA